jgi:hypothetical protein
MVVLLCIISASAFAWPYIKECTDDTAAHRHHIQGERREDKKKNGEDLPMRP